MSEEREVILTLTDAEYRQLGLDIAKLRKATQADSNTHAIMEAVRAAAKRTTVDGRTERSRA